MALRKHPEKAGTLGNHQKFGPNETLTLTKLRLGSTNADLAQRFGISRTYRINYFQHMGQNFG